MVSLLHWGHGPCDLDGTPKLRLGPSSSCHCSSCLLPHSVFVPMERDGPCTQTSLGMRVSGHSEPHIPKLSS